MTQTKIGWRPYVNPISSLLTSIYGAWNGDTTYTSLDVDVISAYNGENTANDSKGTNHGTLVNGATFSTSGKIGSSFYCDGINDYVQFPNNSLNLTGDFSIGLWVNVSTISTWSNYMFLIHNLTQDASGKYYGYRLYLNGNAYVFDIGNGTTTLDTVYFNAGYDVQAQISPVQNHVWKNIVITRKSGQVTKMYIGGNKINPSYNLKAQNNSALSPVYQATHTPYLGRWSNVITMVDCLTFWNRELSISDIDKFYNYNSTAYYSNVNSGVYYYGGDGLQYPFSAQVFPSANDSVSTNHGTLVNGTTFTDGKIGKAFTFDGVNDYVSLPDNSLNLTGDFTISVWVYPTAGTPQSILSNIAYASGTVYKGWQLDINNVSGGQSGKVTFAFGQGPSGGAYTGWEYRTTSLTNNAWNHILIKRVSGVNTYCWVNNISQSYFLFGAGANITTNPTYHTTQYVTIGSAKQLSGVVSNYIANGSKVDGVTVWNRALTDDERTQIYNSGNGKQYPNY